MCSSDLLTDRSIFGATKDQEAILSRLPAANAAQLRAALTASPATVALFENNSGLQPYVSRTRSTSLRLDHTVNATDRVFLRLSYAGGGDSNASTKALVGASRGSKADHFDTVAAAGWTKGITATLLNDLRVQGSYHELAVQSSEPFGPELNIAGFGFFNKDIFLPFDGISRYLEIRNNITKVGAAHTFKAGVQILVRGEHQDSKTFSGGRFGFGTLPAGLVNAALASTTITALQAFNLGLPQSYQQGDRKSTV